jgi:choline-sulfatase
MAEFWDYDSHFDEQTRETAKRAYFGLGSFLDDNVRQVLEALEDSGAARDTVVIYLSDHGEMLGNHGFWGKSVMYEESAGVPLIISGGDVPVGINSTLVSLTDMAATIEDIAGSDSPPRSEPWHGRSALNFIDAPDSDRFILSEYHDGGSPTGFFMVRHETWKYVHYAGDHPDQLFDLEADPGELADRGDDTAFDGHRERLHRLLTSIVDPDAVNAEAFADQARRLDELGGAEAVLARPGFNHTPTPTG